MGEENMSAPEILDVPSVILQFLAVCPAFATPWQAHLTYWGDDQRGDYIDIAVVAHFVVESFEKKQIEPLPAIFGVAEEILRSGHPKQKEIITVGFIEDVQNIASHQPFGSDAFVQFLGPFSRQAWAEIARQWEGKSSLMDVVRSEKNAHPGGTDNDRAAPGRV
jgi:hypothetical protein